MLDISCRVKIAYGYHKCKDGNGTGCKFREGWTSVDFLVADHKSPFITAFVPVKISLILRLFTFLRPPKTWKNQHKVIQKLSSNDFFEDYIKVMWLVGFLEKSILKWKTHLSSWPDNLSVVPSQYHLVLCNSEIVVSD